MIKRKISFSDLFIIFLSLQIILYVFNGDKYYQLPGSYLFLCGALVFGFIAILFSFKNPHGVNKYQVCSLVFLAITVLSGTINLKSIERGYLLSYILLLMLLFVFSTLKFNSKQLHLLSCAYILFALIISFFVIVFRKSYYTNTNSRLTIQIFSETPIDPNYLGAHMVAPLLLAINYAMTLASKKLSIAFWICSALIFLAIFMTGSRGTWVASGVGIIIVMLPLFKTAYRNISKRLTKAQLISLIASVCAQLLICVAAIIILFPDSPLARIFDISTWMDGSNMLRFKHWANAVVQTVKRPILGYGLESTVSSIGEAAHNTFLEICVQTGFINLINILFIFGSILFSKASRYIKAICVATFVFSIFISTQVTLALWLNLGICISTIKQTGEIGSYGISKHNSSDIQC